MTDAKKREQLRQDEKQFNALLVAQARAVGRTVSAIAPDGCEVSATPDGHIFYNTADWW